MKSDAHQELSREEMRERLFVAEKVMKTLFKRNKELEESYAGGVASSEAPAKVEEREGGRDFEKLKTRVIELEKQLAEGAKGQEAQAP